MHRWTRKEQLNAWIAQRYDRHYIRPAQMDAMDEALNAIEQYEVDHDLDAPLAFSFEIDAGGISFMDCRRRLIRPTQTQKWSIRCIHHGGITMRTLYQSSAIPCFLDERLMLKTCVYCERDAKACE